jgi:hypothetical protein
MHRWQLVMATIGWQKLPLNRWVTRCPSCGILDFGNKADRQTAGSKGRCRYDQDGEVVKYSLAYINAAICGADNGRVLGYDNSHDHHHRHFMGQQESLEFSGYEALARRFYDEVHELWRKEDEERHKAR